MQSDVQRAGGTGPAGLPEPEGRDVSAQGPSAEYRIDPAMSRITIKVSAGGLLAGFGHNPTIAMRDCFGEASLAPWSLDQAKVHITVNPHSCEVTDDVSQKDKLEIENRMNQEVLETSRYPEIIFQSTRVTPIRMGEQQYAARIAGSLPFTESHAVWKSAVR